MKHVIYDQVSNGQRLKSLRGEKSREDVASATNISVSALTMYENGQRNPRDEIKCSLASYFGVSVSAIFYPESTL